ncbi:hypothetical protein HEP81_00296 [Streptomyces griseofuscus]|uniref:Uncharacterized protein n=1 Tax=Streptomyces griseofuscus TaxID=146922 RepID=A0A7H1PRF3_9ACTN|nr:hypothetical protein HEP81_00296 [Streptomyces griseofuscus]
MFSEGGYEAAWVVRHPPRFVFDGIDGRVPIAVTPDHRRAPRAGRSETGGVLPVHAVGGAELAEDRAHLSVRGRTAVPAPAGAAPTADGHAGVGVAVLHRGDRRLVVTNRC